MTDPGPGEKGSPNPTNRLIHEVSPYLQQHAHNPVDWYPWGEEAFFKARAEGKPIFLSIGYSTCHWCHVMEKESFSDRDVAKILNAHFICIKVDREERPDIDQLYMDAAIALTGSGGWPLNLILTPDLHPFFAVTYLPKENRMGMPGLLEVLPRLAEFWKENQEKALESAGHLARAIADNRKTRPGGRVRKDAADRLFQDLLLKYDSLNGGFGPAPKFPMPHLHLFLLRYWKWTGNGKALGMTEKTLLSMARGGIYDHLGGGFHRYSTDARWLVPHFEKMLYDQALAAIAFTEAWLATGNQEYWEVASGCLDYVCSRLMSPGGGFLSAEDADSEGVEGKYYLWKRDEIASLLDAEDARVAFLVFPVSRTGNYPDPHTGLHTGENVLHRTHSENEVARILSLSPREVRARIERVKATLLGAREMRTRPFCDDKILADWNGLAIAALAMAGRASGRRVYLDAAEKAASFILSRMRMDDGGLYHRFRDGSAGIPGLSADYAAMVWGLLELSVATRDPRHLESALLLEDYQDSHFWDKRSGGYFTSQVSATDLFARRKEFSDGAIPSPNSVSFYNLVRLGLLTGEEKYSRRADALSRLYSPLVENGPASCGLFMAGFTLSLGPATRVVVTGKGTDPTFLAMNEFLDRNYLPFTIPVSLEHGKHEELFFRLAPLLALHRFAGEAAVAHVCTRNSCAPPVSSVEDLSARVA
ncbi:MAG TPA: thioredoxin domain-containing protein [Methanolinea sp.]|nr:thioredoxin domain-containing protein [Methanolinea sp.]HQK55248.1 thioredoxin domain-containing protein [Methanolinea sp.]